MMIPKKIQEAVELTRKIRSEHPEVESVWFSFKDIPVEEIKCLPEKNVDVIDVPARLRYSYSGDDAVIFFYSRPVKVSKQIIIIYEEVKP